MLGVWVPAFVYFGRGRHRHTGRGHRGRVVEVVSAGERLVVLGLLVRFMVPVDVVHAGVCVDETGREEGEEEEGDTVEAVDVAVSVRG
ncbi:hypothetical protein NDU88_001771 [Pleurodeles waltl]|uniref:Secreted protein n=1 Tax=Pleurodeles waltl TaxID=8319 RepID=A0AAV7NED1_PLEWA|nr:hypothetical protein NDU88_001771 [Pleurodeles waltl]